MIDEQVLAVVADLVSELAGGAGSRPSLDDSLDRDGCGEPAPAGEMTFTRSVSSVST